MTAFLPWMRKSTPNECRDLAVKMLARDDWRESVELVNLLLELGSKERTPEFFAEIDAAIEEQDAQKPR